VIATDGSAAVADFIVPVPGALPASFCDALLAEYGPSREWRPSRTVERAVRRDLRNADNIQLSHDTVVAVNRDVRSRLNEELVRHTVAMLRHYIARFPHFRITRDTGFELLRYREGGFFLQHTDAYHEVERALACSYLLNDDFGGGEFAFFDRARTYAMRRGDALLFPSNFMYPHEVMPVTRGTRYAIVTWFI